MASVRKKLIIRTGENKGGYNSIGRMTVCGTVSSLFKSGYPPLNKVFVLLIVFSIKKK